MRGREEKHFTIRENSSEKELVKMISGEWNWERMNKINQNNKVGCGNN